MTVNQWYQPYDQVAEQNIWNDNIIESIQFYGIDVKYIPRHLVDYDQLLGADDSSRFDSNHMVEMQMINMYGFGGDKDFYSKFGHQVRDEVTFSVSRDRWKTEVGDYENQPVPDEGDLIFVKKWNKLFSIKYVDPREMFYQLGELYTWELTCEVFEFSGETINTGDPDIDAQFAAKNINDVTWALTDEHGNILTDEDDNILVVDGYSLEEIDPGSSNDYLPPELKTTTGLDVNIQDPFGFLQSQ